MRERGGSSPVTLTVERNHLFKNKQQQQQQQHKGTIFKPPPKKKFKQKKRKKNDRKKRRASSSVKTMETKKKTKKKQKKMLRQISVRTGRNIRPDRTRGSAGFRWIAAIRSPSATISTIFFFLLKTLFPVTIDWGSYRIEARTGFYRVLRGFTGSEPVSVVLVGGRCLHSGRFAANRSWNGTVGQEVAVRERNTIRPTRSS